jgi:hypothetical protein
MARLEVLHLASPLLLWCVRRSHRPGTQEGLHSFSRFRSFSHFRFLSSSPPPQHPFFPPPGRSKAPPSPALVIDNLNQPLPTHSSCCYSPHSHNRISSPTGGSSQPPSPSPPFLPGPDQTHGILGCLLLLLVLGFIDMRFAVLRERPVLRCIASHLMAGKNTAVLTRPAQHNWPSRSSSDTSYVLGIPSIRVGLVPPRVSGVLELVPPPSTLD